MRRGFQFLCLKRFENFVCLIFGHILAAKHAAIAGNFEQRVFVNRIHGFPKARQIPDDQGDPYTGDRGFPQARHQS